MPRNTLSRDRIVEAALALLDEEGFEAVTMPSLAKRLGVGTMSLYRHVADKDDLIDAVAERVLSGVAVPDGTPTTGKAGSSATCEPCGTRRSPIRPCRGSLPTEGSRSGPVFEQLEAVHAVLTAAGFSDLGAVRTFYTLLTYVFGFIVWELPRVHQQPAAAYTAAWNAALDQLDPADYPNLHALRRQLGTTASSEQFEYGLQHLVRSLRPPG